MDHRAHGHPVVRDDLDKLVFWVKVTKLVACVSFKFFCME